MAFAASYANDVLDQTLPNAGSGTVTIGATTYTMPFRLLFLTTLSVAATQGTEWATAAGYTHSGAGTIGGVTLAATLGTAATAQAKANTVAVTVTNAPAGTWADNEVVDSTATNKRVAFKGTPSLGKTVNLGDTCTIAIGNLTATLV